MRMRPGVDVSCQSLTLSTTGATYKEVCDARSLLGGAVVSVPVTLSLARGRECRKGRAL